MKGRRERGGERGTGREQERRQEKEGRENLWLV